jgi:hypothetical protein
VLLGCACGLLAALLAGPEPAGAWVPEPERAWSTIAQANTAGGRAQILVLDVALVDAKGQVTATGRAHFDPRGSARLELVLDDGTRDVHDRDGADYRETRGGQLVAKPLRLLPPLALLQAATPAAVADALRAIGGDPARVDLGPEGVHDCWVLGGRDLGAFASNARPSLWIDQDDAQPVRIDDGDRAHYLLGPMTARDGIRLPSWIDVHAPGWPAWRLEVRGATPAS